MIADFLRLAFENITHRKIRSWLTVIGIVIGIAAVVALISLGRGLQYTVDQQFEKIGADKITIQPKGFVGGPGSVSGTGALTKDDLDVVRRSEGVEQAMGILAKTAKVEYNKKQKYSFVTGLPLDESRVVYDESGLYDVEFGRKIKQGDKNKVMVGPEFAKETNFGKAIVVGDKIKIEGKEFTVVGIIKTGGNPGVSQAVLMPIDDARSLFNEPDKLTGITAKADDSERLDFAIANIEKDLRRSRGLDEGKEDFIVISTKKYVESFLVIFNVISVLLIGLASISLLVGAIGIANTMYTAVLERTREIGIMKSIGARNSDIMRLFIIESALIGLIGGVIGVLLGMGLSKLTESLIATFLGEGFFQVFLPWWLLVGAALFAMLIGTLSGVLPARQASNMNPVDALRG